MTALATGLVLVTLLNLIAYCAFGYDKRQAHLGGRRLREDTLLMIALVGGSLGAKLGQRAFRHKTRKQPFAITLNLVIFLQAALVGTVMLTAFAPRDLMQALGSQDAAQSNPAPRYFGPKAF